MSSVARLISFAGTLAWRLLFQPLQQAAQSGPHGSAFRGLVALLLLIGLQRPAQVVGQRLQHPHVLKIRHLGEPQLLEETQEEVPVHLAEPRIKPKQALDTIFAHSSFKAMEGRQVEVAVIRGLLLEKPGRIRTRRADVEKTRRRGLLHSATAGERSWGKKLGNK